jgi:hypothetical protein
MNGTLVYPNALDNLGKRQSGFILFEAQEDIEGSVNSA